MAAKLDYRWHLRQVMATRGMFATTDLLAPLAQRGITLSSSQVYRLVVERPERLSLKILMALLDILDCTMDDLIEPVAAAAPVRKKRAAGGADAGSAHCGPNGPASPWDRLAVSPFSTKAGGGVCQDEPSTGKTSCTTCTGSVRFASRSSCHENLRSRPPDESPILSPPGVRARLLWFGSVDLAGHRIVVWLHRAAYSTGVR